MCVFFFFLKKNMKEEKRKLSFLTLITDSIPFPFSLSAFPALCVGDFGFEE